MEAFGRFFAAIADRYTVVREIGHGGMAFVFLARDVQHEREVAIKVLRPELTESLAAERFLREIQHTSALDHPGILPVLASGDAAGFLYYVMPFVAGATLRQRLAREGQLPIADTVRLAREIAEVLAYAHGRQIIHRDIKPENILLSDGHAIVADFGIARAVSAAGGEQLTSSGVVVGTAAYMSPEQGSFGGKVDARSDVYSLACVVYEMLAGEPPFAGASIQVVITRQMHETPRSLRLIRATVPVHLEEAVRVALAKVPADRFQDVMQFAKALEGDARALPWQQRLAKQRKPALAAAAGAALLIAVWTFGPAASDLRTSAAAPLDTTQYAIFPFEHEAGVNPSLREMQRMHDALARWNGIALADPLKVRDLIGTRDSATLTADAATRFARELKAGRFVRGAVSRSGGDSIRIQVWLYRTADGAVLSDQVVRVPRDLTGSDSAFAALADRMLFRGVLSDSVGVSSGTRSVAARQAFIRGKSAISQWNLPAADSAFSAASGFDPSYADAQLWVALVRAWRGIEAARWRVPAEQALLGQARLSDHDRVMANAIVAEANDDMGRACPLWESLTVRQSWSFAAWYGSAHCALADSAVVADPSSPSHWRFRTSYHHALLAYRRAFELNPSALAAFRQNSYGPLRRLFKISGSAIRTGRPALPDTSGFVAYPSLQGDSVAYVPYPRPALRSFHVPSAGQDAARYLRLQFRDVATAWVTQMPGNPDALEALAIALGMLGDATAMDTLHRARSLSKSAVERERIAVQEVWMQLSFAIPNDAARITSARALADSLLRDTLTSHNPMAAAFLAALTGRAALAATSSSDQRVSAERGIPPALRPAASTLLTYAALGGPRDSVALLVRSVEAAIEKSFVPSQQDGARLAWVVRPATLAYGTYRVESLSNFVGRGNLLFDAQVAWASGDTSAARRGLQAISDLRRDVLPWSLAIDALCPEAELLVEMGDFARAAAWLGPTLDVLPQLASLTSSPERVAALVRAMALRARIASKMGRPDEARRWARAVVTLWSDADLFLRPTVLDLQRLTH